jgi:hypothetical protein
MSNLISIALDRKIHGSSLVNDYNRYDWWHKKVFGAVEFELQVWKGGSWEMAAESVECWFLVDDHVITRVFAHTIENNPIPRAPCKGVSFAQIFQFSPVRLKTQMLILQYGLIKHNSSIEYGDQTNRFHPRDRLNKIFDPLVPSNWNPLSHDKSSKESLHEE